MRSSLKWTFTILATHRATVAQVVFVLRLGDPLLKGPSRDFFLPSNAPMSGAEVRSTEASAPLAG
jgi:hypothetical protein